jgi:CheY-like chemotaxis protein/anti-sigma regulatory factor (Ser/Thr protein kinase)
MDSQRILIVDDDPINRTLLLHMLQQQGYKECYEAKNGEEAIALAAKYNPDIVLLDIVMPGLDGFQVAKHLKENSTSYIPIIFITASDDRSTLLRCLEVGGDDFAQKPFDKFILAAKIKAHLRIRNLASQIATQNTELNTYRQEVDREHAIIEHIYKHALTNPPEALDFFDVKQISADNFNGDLFLTQPHPSGGIYFFLGDFTGHGLASTIGAIPVFRSFAAMTKNGQSVVEIASTLNNSLRTILPPDRFCSAIIGHVNDMGERAIVWHGGLPDMYLKKHADDTLVTYSAKHMALGILSPEEFETDCNIIELEPRDSLYFSSDGIIEATPTPKNDEEVGAKDMLGEEQIRQWIEQGDDLSVTDLLTKVKSQLHRSTFDDDVTMVKFTATDLRSLKVRQAICRLPFSFTVSLGPHELRNEDNVEQIVNVIASQPGMAPLRSDIFTVLSEMYANALEHGVLGLDSKLKDSPEGFMAYYEDRFTRLESLSKGFVKIEINLYPSEYRMAISVSDSGKGFDFMETSIVNDQASSGRGLLLLSEICDALWFEGNGNRIVVEFSV